MEQGIESNQSYYCMDIKISKEYYHLQNYLERLMCTLDFELVIVSGPLELGTNNFDDRRWLT
jgi:hypothetical protein